MLIDTHAHINLHAFKDDADEVLQRALSAGVAVINIGTEYNTSKQGVEILMRHPEGVYAAVGLHPSHTYENPFLDENESSSRTGTERFDYEAYKELAMAPRVVGIGECGLDYYRLPSFSVIPEATSPRGLSGIHPGAESLDSGSEVGMTAAIKQLQKEAFIKQIELARELDKALIIHCRPSKGTNDAYDDVLGILSNLKPLTSNPVLRFEVHSFTGSLDVAQKFIDLGGYIGLNGIITFDKTGNMETVVKGISLERIVLETDSPYLAPSPYRGKRNEPAYIFETAKRIAEWQGVDLQAVSECTTANAVSLFKL